ncbi:MAG: hypothetical protein AAB455_01615 [Patescibacteria group bacterium]|mgnify:CR=1 FL=1
MEDRPFILTPELAVRIQEAVRQAGENQDFVEQLINPTKLSEVAAVIRGEVMTCEPDDIVPLGAEAWLPNAAEHEHWAVYSHIRQPNWRFQSSQLKLFRSEVQIKGGVIRGDKLLNRQELRGKSLANSCLLDWFRLHIARVPREWSELTGDGRPSILFPGTIYRDGAGYLAVRCLTEIDDRQWTWQSRRIKSYWSPNDFVLYVDPPLRT